jgi:predicted O-methyltransferase YrrM
MGAAHASAPHVEPAPPALMARLRLARQGLWLLRREGVLAFGRQGAAVASFYTRTAVAALLFRRRMRQAHSLDEAFTLASTFEFRKIVVPPVQFRDEFLPFLEDVAAMSPTRLLEIDVGYGGTLFLLARAAGDRARLAAIDLPPEPARYHQSKELLFQVFRSRGQRIRIFPTGSRNPATLDAVSRFLGDGIDVLLIDGDHTYEGVSTDYRMYGPLVRPGGLIAFHDIVPGACEKVGEVARFWAELKEAAPGEVTEDGGAGSRTATAWA